MPFIYLPHIRKSLHSRCQPMEAISITFSVWSLIAHHAEEGGKMRCLRWFCHDYYSSQGTRWSLLTNTADGESVQVTLEGHDNIQASRTLQSWFALLNSLRSRGCRFEDSKAVSKKLMKKLKSFEYENWVLGNLFYISSYIERSTEW